MTRNLADVLVDASRALEGAGIQSAVVGGFAVAAWGEPRFTRDVDVVARVDAAKADDLARTLAAAGFHVPPEDIRDGARSGSHFTIFDCSSQYHVDVKPARTPLEFATISGARRVKFEGVEVPVSSPEDRIAHKLRFGSPQDVLDAEGIYQRQRGRLDLDALAARCRTLGVIAELNELRARIDAGQ